MNAMRSTGVLWQQGQGTRNFRRMQSEADLGDPLGKIYKVTTENLAHNQILDFHIIRRAEECFKFFSLLTVDTEGTEKDVVSFGLFSKEGMVTIVWT